MFSEKEKNSDNFARIAGWNYLVLVPTNIVLFRNLKKCKQIIFHYFKYFLFWETQIGSDKTLIQYYKDFLKVVRIEMIQNEQERHLKTRFQLS